MTDADHHPESGHNASADAMIEAIRDALRRRDIVPDTAAKRYSWHDADDRARVLRQFRANDPDSDDRVWSKALLPGFGELGQARTAKESCGDPHPVVCKSCGHGLTIGNTCQQSVCGRCAPAWCRRAAKQKAAKIQALRQEKYYSTPENMNANIYHLTISPRLGWYADLARAGLTLDEAQDVTRSVVKKILDEFHAQGVLVRHPYSGEKEDGSVAGEDDDLGEWSDRLFNGKEWRAVRSELAWKPHYHAIVVSDWIKTGEHRDDEDVTERVESETGWVIHRITSENSENSLDDGQMARAVMYCLSHGGIDIDQDGPNRSQVWEVGSFEDDPIASTPRFTPSDANDAWAERVTAKYSGPILGVSVTGSDCGKTLPAIEDTSQFARNVLSELFPDEFGEFAGDPLDRIDERVVMGHVADGTISVSVSSSGGGGSGSSVTDVELSDDHSATSLAQETPDIGANTQMAAEAKGDGVTHGDDDPPEHGEACSCGDCSVDALADDLGVNGHPAVERDGPEECDGTLIPLGEARERGLLEDDEWLAQADHAGEALELDREWPDDLPPWFSAEETDALGIG